MTPRCRSPTYAGKPVVLIFYPGDDSPVCTKQLNAYNDGLDQFADLDAQVIGISAQDMASKEAFVAKHGFEFPLLADTDKEVAAAYGTLGPIGFPRRSTFIIDGDGIIRYAHRAIAGLDVSPGQRADRRSSTSSAERRTWTSTPSVSEDEFVDPRRASTHPCVARSCEPSPSTSSSPDKLVWWTCRSTSSTTPIRNARPNRPQPWCCFETGLTKSRC